MANKESWLSDFGCIYFLAGLLAVHEPAAAAASLFSNVGALVILHIRRKKGVVGSLGVGGVSVTCRQLTRWLSKAALNGLFKGNTVHTRSIRLFLFKARVSSARPPDSAGLIPHKMPE